MVSAIGVKGDEVNLPQFKRLCVAFVRSTFASLAHWDTPFVRTLPRI